jgi:hypothetical protein
MSVSFNKNIFDTGGGCKNQHEQGQQAVNFNCFLHGFEFSLFLNLIISELFSVSVFKIYRQVFISVVAIRSKKNAISLLTDKM